MSTVIDFEFDPNELATYLENLSLENTIPVLSEDSLSILKESEANVNSHDSKEQVTSEGNKPVRFVKIEDENTLLFSKQEPAKNLDIPLKKGFDVKSLVKSEVFSDSDTEEDEENSTNLLERGGPEKVKRRAYKKKGYERKHVSVNELDEQKRMFLSSGQIIQNNLVSFPTLPLQAQNTFTELESIDFNYLTSYQDLSFINTSKTNYEESETNNSIFLPFPQCSVQYALPYADSIIYATSVGSPEVGFINSPESGYDTSQSNGVNSPSPPPFESQSYNFDEELEKEIEIQHIVDTLFELEKSYKNSKIGPSECNLSVLDDVNSSDYIENLKIFLQEPQCNEITDQKNSEIIVEKSFKHCATNVSLCNATNLNDQVQLENLSDNVHCSSSATKNFKTFAKGIPMPKVEFLHKMENKSTERKISFKLKDVAKYHLRFSEYFDDVKYKAEEEKLLKEIQLKQQKGQELSVIHIIEDDTNENSNQTNLQRAILESNIEKIYLLVEAHKRFCRSLFEINHDDAFKKTALDYALQRNMPLVIDYLRENKAVPGKTNLKTN